MNKKSKINTQDVNNTNEKTLSARISAKKKRLNVNTETICHYKNIICKCKKDIANGIDVKVNEATIIELEESINFLKISNNKISQSLMDIKE